MTKIRKTLRLFDLLSFRLILKGMQLFYVLTLISDLLLTVFTARAFWFLHKRWKTPEGDLQNLYYARIKFSIYAAAAFLLISGALRLIAAHYAAL